MSLPWSKSIRIRIEPHRVSAMTRRAWPSRAAPGQAEALVGAVAAGVAPEPAALAASVSSALDAVLASLAATAPLQGARMQVELADSLVHLDVIEGDFSRSSDRELQTIADACTAEVLGDATSSHVLRWVLQRREHHLFVCAVPRVWLDLLLGAMSRHGMSLRCVSPAFARQWNRHGHAFASGAGVFAVRQHASTVIAWVDRGVVCSVGTSPLPGCATLDAGAGVWWLDRQVDRFLASIGHPAAADHRFVVAPGLANRASYSPRWQVATEVSNPPAEARNAATLPPEA